MKTEHCIFYIGGQRDICLVLSGVHIQKCSCLNELRNFSFYVLYLIAAGL